jgi:hypothetical protein
MINLRYHIVSLIAVLLALVLGVAAGSAVVDKGLVSQLESNLDRLEKNLNDASKNNDHLSGLVKDQRDVQRQFDDAARARYLSGLLPGVPVLLVSLRGVDDQAVSDLSEALQDAGAQQQETVWLEPKVALEQANDVTRFAEALAVTDTEVASLNDRFATQISTSLVRALARATSSRSTSPGSAVNATSTTGATSASSSVAPAPTAAAATSTSATSTTSPSGAEPEGATELGALLEKLRQGGFVALDRPDNVVAPSLSDGVVVIVDSPSVPDPQRAALLALVRQLGAHPSVPTVVVEVPADTPKGASLVDIVRSDNVLRDRISTVDDARSLYGWAGTAMAAEQLRLNKVGHYGHGKGASGLLPTTTS